jgi:hypothetical protein
MKPGDLVRVKESCHSTDGTLFKCGDVGFVMGTTDNPYYLTSGCLKLFINGTIEHFHPRMIEAIDANR